MGTTRQQLARLHGTEVADLVGDVTSAPPRLVMVGINPSLMTAATGTHFAHPTNRFYPALHRAGITARQLDPTDGLSTADRDHLLGQGVAITNLVARATASAAELSAEELRAGAVALEERISRWAPRVVAVAGVSAYRVGFRQREARLGPQAGRLGGAELWVVPNPSGLNAHETVASLADWYRAAALAAGIVGDGRPDGGTPSTRTRSDAWIPTPRSRRLAGPAPTDRPGSAASTGVTVSAPVTHPHIDAARDSGVLRRTASIHARELPDGFFARLGPRFLRRYHQSFVDSPLADVLVAGGRREPTGMLVGTYDNAAHYQWVARHRSWLLALAGLVALLRRPRLAAEFLRTRVGRYARAAGRFLGRRRGRAEPAPSASPRLRVAVLTHVAVDEAAQGSGLGRDLVRVFVQRARCAGADEVRLITPADGPGPGFYRSLDWQRLRARQAADGTVVDEFVLSL